MSDLSSVDHRYLSRRQLLVAGGLVSAGGISVLTAPVAQAAVGAMVWPIDGPVTSRIGLRTRITNGKKVTRMHEGIDISANTGTPVFAAASGTVVAATSYSGYGNTVIIDHGIRCANLPTRWFTLYGHLNGYNVKAGATVKIGDQIATSGNTGSGTGPHLHFEALQNTAVGASAALNGAPWKNLNDAIPADNRLRAKTPIEADFVGLRTESGVATSRYFVGMAAADSAGYWLVARDGGVFTFGGKEFFGSMGGRPLNAAVVGMAPRSTGDGYWLVAADGGIFAYGAAAFHGSMGDKPLNKPMVGIAAHPSGNGYWTVASDGGIFAYGAAAFHGSMGDKPLNKPMVGIAAHPSGNGYWTVASDGGIFAYGAATTYGSGIDFDRD